MHRPRCELAIGISALHVGEANRARELTNQRFFAEIGGSIEMEKNGKVIGIIGGVEFGDVEQAPTV